jgi:radical SAM-linked protein
VGTRVRLIYEKRGGACFVPHIALATLFARAARRAGISLRSTDGFSPHSKMSFGPELPAGVVALGEPLDVWLNEAPKEGADLAALLNAQMPEGFRVRKCLFPAEDGPALGKECKAAHYLIWPREGRFLEPLAERLKSHFGEEALSLEAVEPENGSRRISLVLAAPAKNGIGGWVKALVAEDLAAGWQDLCIVRTALGRWDGARMEPLSEE